MPCRIVSELWLVSVLCHGRILCPVCVSPVQSDQNVPCVSQRCKAGIVASERQMRTPFFRAATPPRHVPGVGRISRSQSVRGCPVFNETIFSISEGGLTLINLPRKLIRHADVCRILGKVA
jgi:hypothetical protein